MSRQTRNRALAVIDGQITLARQELDLRIAARAEAESTLNALMAMRERVAKAYERKPKAVVRRSLIKAVADAVAGQGDSILQP